MVLNDIVVEIETRTGGGAALIVLNAAFIIITCTTRRLTHTFHSVNVSFMPKPNHMEVTR